MSKMRKEYDPNKVKRRKRKPIVYIICEGKEMCIRDRYYRTRITDADGKQVSLYATTCEELYEKQLEARRQVDEIIFHRKHPTVAEYCEKWLLMQSAKVSTATIKGYLSLIHI